VLTFDLRTRNPAMAHRYLTLSEREMIALLVAAGESLREIGRTLARAPSTIVVSVRAIHI